MTVQHAAAKSGETVLILPHFDAIDWSLDGTTLGPNIECEGWEPRREGRCDLFAVVELIVIEGIPSALLCGKHYGLHRRGIPIRLVR